MNKQTSIALGSILIIGILIVLYYKNMPADTESLNTVSDTTEATSSLPSTSMNEQNPQINELLIETLTEGTGVGAQNGSQVTVHYVGMFMNNQKFDSSRDRGEPFTFTLGAGDVIRGWDEGLLGMKVGEKRRLTIPSNLAYGPQGIPGAIPPGATLMFEVEMLEIE